MMRTLDERRKFGTILLFSITIFLSSFLLFQIQPLISRYILPWFGGAPAVWSAAMLFFQVFLLAGYAYAHWLSTHTHRRLIFHTILLAGSLIVLGVSALFWGVPLLPGPSWRPPDASLPFARIVLVLLASVGFPYFLLSSTSPLLQAWFKTIFPDETPYKLYALSNFASFFALLSYPVVFEPLLGLKEQSRLWSLGYLFFTLLGGLLSIFVFRAQKIDSLQSSERMVEELKPLDPSPPSLFQKLAWIGLPATASILLLAITNQLTQEVAVIPFLWVLPLSIYLFSFIVTFSGEKWYQRNLILILLGISTLLLWYGFDRFVSLGALILILIFSFFLLMACLVCHGELYRLRPDPQFLTTFYLMVSLGGAAGGLFVNLAAPVIFQGYWELHTGVLFCWLAVLLILAADRQSIFHRRWVWVAAPLFLGIIGLSAYAFYFQVNSTRGGVLEMERNFYGVFRVRPISVGEPPADAVSLNHGITAHGLQFTQPEKRGIPTTYYGRRSGIGLAIANYARAFEPISSPQALRIGVIGLGAGTLAAYGKSGDYFRFYEINPDIIDLALGKNGYFTYLKDTQADFDIIPGDARLSLEYELEKGQPQNFDIFAVDAFSSDSIPVHLLTQEAFSVYLQHLKPEGVLAIHISNRYLDLAPLIQALAGHYGLEQTLIASPRDDTGAYPAVWVLLSKNHAFFELPEIGVSKKDPPATSSEIRVWTDDYSNLLQFVRMNRVFNFR